MSDLEKMMEVREKLEEISNIVDGLESEVLWKYYSDAIGQIDKVVEKTIVDTEIEAMTEG